MEDEQSSYQKAGLPSATGGLLTMDDIVILRYRGGQKREPGVWIFKVSDIKYIVVDGARCNIIYSKKIEEKVIERVLNRHGQEVPRLTGQTIQKFVDDTAVILCGLQKIWETLSHLSFFFKPNKSSIVNLQHVEKFEIEDQIVTLKLYGGYIQEMTPAIVSNFFDNYRRFPNMEQSKTATNM